MDQGIEGCLLLILIACLLLISDQQTMRKTLENKNGRIAMRTVEDRMLHHSASTSRIYGIKRNRKNILKK